MTPQQSGPDTCRGRFLLNLTERDRRCFAPSEDVEHRQDANPEPAKHLRSRDLLHLVPISSRLRVNNKRNTDLLYLLHDLFHGL
jgi:hypothetical protein